MTPADLLSPVNPLTDDAAARLPVDGAEHEMLDALVAVPIAPPPGAPVVRRARVGRRRLLAIAGAVTVILPIVAVLSVLPAGRHARPQPAPLPGSAVPSPASPSPRVLLQMPAWRVSYADEQSALWGELDFTRTGGTGGSAAGVGGGLTWFPASDVRGYVRDRGAEASTRTRMPLLGATARLFESKAAAKGTHSFTAIWTMGRRGLMFEARARDMPAFRAELRHLHVVSEATWLKAMPASVVPTTRRNAVIRQMLEGIPLPPGFRTRQIPGAALVRDHYQLATAVTGTVACEWFARWGRGRNTGNQSEVDQAVAAMATATHWPILRELSRQGGWTSILVGYAKAMPRGRWFGRPLLPDVDSGLGCSGEWHIKLGAAPVTPTGRKPAK